MFKCWKFKREARDCKIETFQKMKNETDANKWEQLKKMYEMYDKMEKPGGHICTDTILSIVGTLATAVLVLRYEEANIIVSKAWSLVRQKKI